jgi:uncharacterized membrane protein
MERLSDLALERSIARMLIVGITLAALLVIVGGLLLMRQPHVGLPDYRHFHGEDISMRSVSAITRGAAHLAPLSVIQFGILVMIATPIVRVAFCVGGFLRQRNGLYIAISLIVLAVLLYSLTKGAH